MLIAMSTYIAYLALCSDGTYYAGICTDPERRLAQHNGMVPGGAKYTHSRRPVRFVYQELWPDRSSASKREYELKGLSRPQKEALASTWDSRG